MTGIVYVDGSPAEGVQVHLHDVKGLDPNQPTISHTVTGPGGEFSVSTYEHGDGVPGGDYTLTFVWQDFHVVSMQYSGPDKLNNRYADPAKSEIKVKVEKGKPSDLGKVELKSQ